MEHLKEMATFLAPTTRLDLKSIAMEYVLGLTGSIEGKTALLGLEEVIAAIFHLTNDPNSTIAKDAVMSLINLTAEEYGARKVIDISNTICPAFKLVKTAIDCVIDENSVLADRWSIVLANLTRFEAFVVEVIDEIENNKGSFTKLANAYVNLNYNKKNEKLHHLGSLFCNMSSCNRGREILCNSKTNLLQRILPFASYEASIIRRGGTIGLLKNVCFDQSYHELILGDTDDIIYALLYPLCGPEEFSDEENEKLPIELQYLPDSKTREEDTDLRKMILECLLQLCATKRCREHLRSKGVYEILREYHKWEALTGKDKECLMACENVVDILIKKEEEIGVDSYKEIEVPVDVSEKFTKEDLQYLNDQ